MIRIMNVDKNIEIIPIQDKNYYAVEDQYARDNCKNILCWDIYKINGEKSFARLDYFKWEKCVVIMLFRKDTGKRFLKYLLQELSKDIEIEEIRYQDKCFNTIKEIRI